MDTTTDATESNSWWARFRDWFGWKIALFGMLITTKQYREDIKYALTLGVLAQLSQAGQDLDSTPFEEALQELADKFNAIGESFKNLDNSKED